MSNNQTAQKFARLVLLKRQPDPGNGGVFEARPMLDWFFINWSGQQNEVRFLKAPEKFGQMLIVGVNRGKVNNEKVELKAYGSGNLIEEVSWTQFPRLLLGVYDGAVLVWKFVLYG